MILVLQDWDTGQPDHVEHPFDFKEEEGAPATLKGRVVSLALDIMVYSRDD